MAKNDIARIRQVLYAILHFFVRLCFRVLFRMRIVGEEYIPRNEPVIIVANHTSNIDPVVMGVAAPQELNYMAKEELFRNTIFRWLIVAFRAFPVHRGTVDRKAISKALEILSRCQPLLFFPEGTRGDGKNIRDAKPGTGLIIYKARAKVVPALIKGAEKIMPRNAKFIRFHKLEVYFGKPLDLEKFYEMADCRGTYELIATEITRSLRKLNENKTC